MATEHSPDKPYPDIPVPESGPMPGNTISETTIIKPRDTNRKVSFFAMVLVLCALISGGLTFVAVSRPSIMTLPPEAVEALLLMDMVLAVLLVVLIVQHLVGQWSAFQQRKEGARLEGRLITAVALLTCLPTMIISVLAIFFVAYSIDGWFSKRIQLALDESRIIAEAYRLEHQRNILRDAVSMARMLEGRVQTLGPGGNLNDDLVHIARQHDIPEAIVFDPQQGVLGRAGLTFALELEVVGEDKLRQAGSGRVVILNAENQDRIRALIRLPGFANGYLIVGRYVAPEVFGRIEQTRAAVSQYQLLVQNRATIEVAVGIALGVIALLLLTTALWIGMAFAHRLVSPLGALIEAVGALSRGRLNTRVEVRGRKHDEITVLAHNFNTMAETLESQRVTLDQTVEALEERRRFVEQVLADVSAGVLALNDQGDVHIANEAAHKILDTATPITGQNILSILPEVAPWMDSCRTAQEAVDTQITLTKDRAEERHLHVRVAPGRGMPDSEGQGFVVTFDDLTPLALAQRRAAWIDVARRIAHEIKNPLTPILLSSERLKRRILPEIQDEKDRGIFETCVQSIARQVRIIGALVDEFSQFARLPKPVFRAFDLAELCRQCVFLQFSGWNQRVAVNHEGCDEPLMWVGDQRQLSQVLVNLIKNSCESASQFCEENTAPEEPEVVVRLTCDDDTITIDVEDNGAGFPAGDRHALLEPYVTHKESGSGIGLAVVARIIGEHQGQITLMDRPEGRGALVRVVLPQACEAEKESRNGEDDVV